MASFKRFFPYPVVNDHHQNLQHRYVGSKTHVRGCFSQNRTQGIFVPQQVLTCTAALRVDRSKLSGYKRYWVRPTVRFTGMVAAFTGSRGGLIGLFGTRPSAEIRTSSTYTLFQGLGRPYNEISKNTKRETLIDVNRNPRTFRYVGNLPDIDHGFTEFSVDPTRNLYLVYKIRFEIFLVGDASVCFSRRNRDFLIDAPEVRLYES